MNNGSDDTNERRWREMPPVKPERLNLSRPVDPADRTSQSAWFQPLEQAAHDEAATGQTGSERFAYPLSRPGMLDELHQLTEDSDQGASDRSGNADGGASPWFDRPPSLLDPDEEATSLMGKVRDNVREHWKIVAAMASVLVLLVAFMQRGGTESETELGDPLATAALGDLEPLDGQLADNGSVGDVPTPSVSTGQMAAGQEPFVRYRWEGNILTLSGYVPDGELRSLLAHNARALHGNQYVIVDLAEVPSAPVPSWMWMAPEFVFEVTKFVEADAVLADGRLQLTGSIREMERGTELAAFMQGRTGLPVEILSLELVNLRAAQWRMAWQDGRVLLAGALPSEELRATFLAEAGSRFGAGNVIDSSSVDPSVQFEHWMREADWMFAAFSNFERVTLEQNGEDFFIGLGGGPSFASGEADDIDLGEAIYWISDHLYEDPGLLATIRGHTDAVGSASANLYLSQLRANVVREQFLSNGVAPDQIEAIGVGATEPIASDATVEGREENRRIEIVLTRREIQPELLGQGLNNDPSQQVGQVLEPTG